MPGSDSDPDKIQTYGQDNSGKSKTSQIAPDQIGRANADPVTHQGVLETEQSVRVTEGEATDTVHYGRDQDRQNAGDESVALGVGARATGGGDSIVAVGYEAAQNNTGGFGVTATGNRAAQNNTASRVTATGLRAAQENTGDAVTASGYQAARNNTGDELTASGRAAAFNNTGNGVTVAGFEAARGDGLADPTTMGDDNIGIGDSAIRNNQASGLIAIGQEAGINAQTDDQLIITDRNGNRRLVMDLTNGDLSIEGSLTENATL
jgi:hypothetical protein